jgi:hypothetical protein
VFVCLASLLWAELLTRAENIFIFQQYLCVSLPVNRTFNLEYILLPYAGGYFVITSPAVVLADFVSHYRTLEPERLLMKKTAPEIQEGKVQGIRISIAFVCRLRYA